MEKKDLALYGLLGVGGLGVLYLVSKGRNTSTSGPVSVIPNLGSSFVSSGGTNNTPQAVSIDPIPDMPTAKPGYVWSNKKGSFKVPCIPVPAGYAPYFPWFAVCPTGKNSGDLIEVSTPANEDPSQFSAKIADYLTNNAPVASSGGLRLMPNQTELDKLGFKSITEYIRYHLTGVLPTNYTGPLTVVTGATQLATEAPAWVTSMDIVSYENAVVTWLRALIGKLQGSGVNITYNTDLQPVPTDKSRGKRPATGGGYYLYPTSF